MSENPFFKEYGTPFETPAFDKIKEEHYLPAFREGIRQQQVEIEAIVNNPEPPTFENTIEALERSGALLTKVGDVFNNLTESNTNDNLQKIAEEVSPLLSKNDDDILLNAKLFARIKAVYDQLGSSKAAKAKAKGSSYKDVAVSGSVKLSVEQKKLLDDTYRDFVRGGANLDAAQQAELREINKNIALLQLKFSQNVLKENNTYRLGVDKKEDLAGLPQGLIDAAAQTAKETKSNSPWVFTLQNASIMPFLQYAENRGLREKIFKAYLNRGNNGTQFDNKENASKIVSLRVKRAHLLGYKTHADFVLEKTMAKNPANVSKLLKKLWTPAIAMAKREAKDMQEMINKEPKPFKLEAWDWRYYAEKVKKAKFDLDEEEIRPYLKLDNIRDAAFDVARKLYGITLTERFDIPKYHPDVKVFEVKEADGKHVGIMYFDYHPRDSKRGGAWMESFRKQSRENGKEIRPIICNVCNFTKPTGDTPALLTFDEATTLFHEFGHALHGLLSNSTYGSLSGTAVARDFVELPSQIMENWISDPEVLRMYAKHYKTGEPMPQSLIDKIKKAGTFNQGFATVEYLAASVLDMDWHTIADTTLVDPLKFEAASMKKLGLIPEIAPRYRTQYFNHIFNSGYSAGYYSYIWAAVLDADAFQAFKDKGLFDQTLAKSFRSNVLERGGTEDPMTLYKRFRGAEPDIKPLLKRRGLL
ncbi:MAG TPA: M3 family metallopeptidase [Bacteroidota bacterium]|nr:M3 family metallopeptidase [Bacteroidota bacterium]